MIAMAAADRAAKSHKARLSFEQKAMAAIIITLVICLILCFIAIWPSQWAKEVGDRINAMRESITYFISLIAGTLGLSFGRGAVTEIAGKKESD